MPAKPANQTRLPQCAAILASQPTVIDREAVKALVGERTVATLNEVAREFAMSPNTVKQSWRSAGMPGENGNYPLAEILVWRLEHEAATGMVRNRFANATDAQIARQRTEAEVRKLQLQCERMEREEELAWRDLVPVQDVERAVAAIRETLAETLSELPAILAPRFPEHMREECVEESRREVERTMRWFSESAARIIQEQQSPKR